MRSGTHLTIDLLRRNASEVSARYLNLDQLMADHREPLGREAFDRALVALGPVPVLKTHVPASPAGWFGGGAGPERARELLAAGRVVYVVRDGRDVLVSLFHYMRRYDKRVREQRFADFLRDPDDFFQACPGFEGLDRAAAWARHVEGWLDEPRAAVVRYEDLLARRDATLRALAGRLGLELSEVLEEVPRVVGLAGRLRRRLVAAVLPRRASTAITPRRGVSGEAATHFSPDDRAFFAERAGPVQRRVEALGDTA
jgi:hypothetical protein